MSLRDVASAKALALDMLKFGLQSCFHLFSFRLEEQVSEQK